MSTNFRPSQHSAVPFWRDIRVLRVVGQVVFAAVVILFFYGMFTNLTVGMKRFTSFNFDFLQSPASLPLSESPIPYDPFDPYYKSFIVGVLNTLRVIVVGIFLASILGLFGGIARLSSNWLISRLAQGYVEIFRNTPLLIQLYFWYLAGVLRLPRVRDSFQIPGGLFLSNRGLVMPWLVPTNTFVTWLGVAGAALVVAVIVYLVLCRLRLTSFFYVYRGLVSTLIFILIGVVGAMTLNAFTVSNPVIKGFNFEGGLQLSPEYTALLFGLVVYTGAYITEIVRAGIQAVPRGLREASYALGLNYEQTLRMIILPVALRVIIPPLTNQYLNLAKNSSLAVAIGYADLFYVGGGIFNQTGQTIQVIAMLMVTYLAISLIIAALMNLVNQRFKLVER
jgi:general L-amino acid transport system permease protein